MSTTNYKYILHYPPHSEYLFLLTILIKPQSGFKIAFAMLDQDGNERIDKDEFKVLETVFSSAAKERKDNQKGIVQQDSAEDATEAANPKKIDFDDSDHGLSRSHAVSVDTSLHIYFFGKRGDGDLSFDDFRKFMDNLQTEVLQMEYNEFAKGAVSITELDFARILLRYTFLNTEEYEAILDRLLQRLNEEIIASDGKHQLQGITFDEFKDFCLFLNTLDDFQVQRLLKSQL
jgi:Ca2+-binding EF-hand superfamily protein